MTMSRVGLDVAPRRAEGVEVGIQPPAADDVAAGRRHLGAAEARQQRAGEQERGADALGAARGRRARRRSTPGGAERDLVVARQSTLTPRPRSSSSIASTSRMRGTLRTSDLLRRSGRRRRGWAARRSCCRPGRRCRDSGTPPSMTNFSMLIVARRSAAPGPGAERWASVTAMSPPLSRDEAWDLLTEWVESPSLRRHCLAVEAAMRADARDAAATTRSCGASSACCTTWTTSAIPTWTRRPATRAMSDGRARARDATPEIVRAIASHADYLGVPRESPLEQDAVRRRRAVGLRRGLRARCAPRASAG